ncbi:similar to Saccharomyces cerevisiae YGL066W SGF73 SAGA complex subunit [Maudiozyma saulgeensis]|uniref:Similar to Saccharomyces cerevisiae YGL066W SGF73 SAGA complex subunit n=1 Tax=Maudiozyma saulgeensis TaxID=1789683 RepID=A0A1X7R004_9SACH|nr:similar to Saccharomyces cerevisiae YGL066W SGF73 SAGA complex subunit [Kazachstania saulgeensis]
MSRIIGLKNDILISSTPETDNKNWKSLLKTAKTNKIQYSNIDNDLLKEHFNPNANIIPTENAFAGYRICKSCGKPILLNSIIDHIQNHCPGSTGGSTSSSSPNLLADRESASKTLPGTYKENSGRPLNGFSVAGNGNSGNSEGSLKNNISQSNVNDNDSNRTGSTKNSTRREEDDDEDDDDGEDEDDDDGEDDEDDEDDDDDDDDEDEDDEDDDDDDDINSSMRSSSSGKKRPPPISGESPSSTKRTKMHNKKKKQRNIKQRNPTDKHLIDFDKQCGVDLPEGGYCARSLTCKSHSMGAKRAVEGRTKTFDELLANYHREHQTKIGAAAEKRAKQQELQKIQKAQLKEQKEQKKLLQQKQRQIQKQTRNKEKNTNTSRTKASSNSKANATKTTNTSIPVLTPEEETTQVLNGVSRSFPLPLETTVLSSTRVRTKYIRMREMFASAFSIKPGFTSPGYGSIHSRVGCLDIDRTTDYKFRIRIPQPVNPITGTSNLTPQQIQKLQQHRMLQAQMLAKQQQNQGQNSNQSFPIAVNSGKVPNSVSNAGASKPPPDNSTQEKGLTPQEIQLQQQKLRQQQLQQQKFEAAAFHLANASKLMQNTSNGGSPVAVNNGSPEHDDNNSSNKQNSQVGSPNSGRVNVGLGNQVNNYGGRVN